MLYGKLQGFLLLLPVVQLLILGFKSQEEIINAIHRVMRTFTPQV